MTFLREKQARFDILLPHRKTENIRSPKKLKSAGMVGGKEKVEMGFDVEESGKRIRRSRKDLGLTQEQLLKRMEEKNRGRVTVRHLQRLEKGEKTFSLDLFLDLSNTLEVSTDYLLARKEFESSAELKTELLAVIDNLYKIVEKIR